MEPKKSEFTKAKEPDIATTLPKYVVSRRAGNIERNIHSYFNEKRKVEFSAGAIQMSRLRLKNSVIKTQQKSYINL